MKHTFIQLIHILIIAVPAAAIASGMGPFDIPPLGNIEVFRELPSFISPSEQTDKKLLYKITTRCINTWTYNIESVSEEPYSWDTTKDYPFEHGSFLLDMESYSFIQSISYKLSEKIWLETSIPVIHQTGGILDSSIERFHDSFSLGQHHRTDWDKNSISLVYITPDGETVYYNEHDLRGVFLGNITIGSSYRVKSLSVPTCLRLLITLPTSEVPISFSKDSYNMTLQAIFSWESNNIIGYHGAGITHYSNNESNGLNLFANRLSLMTTFEYKKTEHLSFIMHFVAASPVADYPMLDDPIIEMTLGLKRRFGPGILEVGIIENLFFFDNSPDIGIHIGYSVELF